MALSYNTQQINGSGKLSSKVIVGLIGVVIIIIFVGGYYANTALSSYRDKQLSAQAKDYVSLLVGNKVDQAYAKSGPNITSKVAVADFRTIVGNVSSSNPTYTNQKLEHVDSTDVAYVVKVNNLPPTASGRTDGVFIVSMAKTKSKWQVSSLSIQ